MMFGKLFDKSIAEAAASKGNPLESIMKNPMIKGMAKSYRKEILEALTKGEQDLIGIIERIELLPGETQVAPILDIDLDANGNKEIRLIVAAFEKSTLTRVISDTPLRQFLTDWYLKQIK